MPLAVSVSVRLITVHPLMRRRMSVEIVSPTLAGLTMEILSSGDRHPYTDEPRLVGYPPAMASILSQQPQCLREASGGEAGGTPCTRQALV